MCACRDMLAAFGQLLEKGKEKDAASRDVDSDVSSEDGQSGVQSSVRVSESTGEKTPPPVTRGLAAMIPPLPVKYVVDMSDSR